MGGEGGGVPGENSTSTVTSFKGLIFSPVYAVVKFTSEGVKGIREQDVSYYENSGILRNGSVVD